MAKKTWEEIEEGQIGTATVRLVTPYRVIVDIGGIQAVIPPSELSWGWVNDPRDIVQVGESFDVKIIHVDRE
ncbi:MAG: S1 RNA-binding domain-containing protein, partial [Chloroflexi bacterium]|nr:S1 RNA-binding domain-containing protein [Chloroflexota bacterium]